MQVEAIYLLTPTAQNVERVIADFSDGRKTYNSAHLYFIDGGLTEGQLDASANCGLAK